MVRQARHDRVGLPLVLSSSKDALRSKRYPLSFIRWFRMFQSVQSIQKSALNANRSDQGCEPLQFRIVSLSPTSSLAFYPLSRLCDVRVPGHYLIDWFRLPLSLPYEIVYQ